MIMRPDGRIVSLAMTKQSLDGDIASSASKPPDLLEPQRGFDLRLNLSR